MKVQFICFCLLALGALTKAALLDKNFDYDETGKCLRNINF